MNSAARKRRIEIASTNKPLANQAAPRPVRMSSGKSAPLPSAAPPAAPPAPPPAPMRTQNLNGRLNSTSVESQKTAKFTSPQPQAKGALFTLPDAIKIIDERLITLETKAATEVAEFEDRFSSSVADSVTNIMAELEELRGNILKIEETQHAHAKFMAEAMRVLFEATGCKPNKSLEDLGLLVGIEVSDIE
jgi:hypothetical protein